MGKTPPKSLEWFFSLITPPAVREHVIGDLRERYATTPRYIAESIVTIFYVIASRIVSTAVAAIVLLEALALYAAFLAAARGPFENYAGLAVPAAVALAALILIDAYAKPGPRTPPRHIRDTVLALAIACIVELPEQLIPIPILLQGAALSILLVAAIRMLFLWDSDQSKGAG